MLSLESLEWESCSRYKIKLNNYPGMTEYACYIKHYLNNKPYNGLAYLVVEEDGFYEILKCKNGVIIENTISKSLPATNPLAKALYD